VVKRANAAAGYSRAGHMIATALTITRTWDIITHFAAYSGEWYFAICRSRCAVRSTASSTLSLASFALVVLNHRRGCEVTDRRQTSAVTRRAHTDLFGHDGTSIHRLTASIRYHGRLLSLLPGLRLCFGSRSRLWQELLEVSEKVRCSLEEVSNLTIHVLDWL
jgi:hypothetical protein